jgi:hypothetical protein
MLAGLVGKKECEHGGLEVGGLPICRLGKKSVNCVGQLDLHGLLLPVGLNQSEAQPRHYASLLLLSLLGRSLPCRGYGERSIAGAKEEGV